MKLDYKIVKKTPWFCGKEHYIIKQETRGGYYKTLKKEVILPAGIINDAIRFETREEAQDYIDGL
jgi:hypothetical protein